MNGWERFLDEGSGGGGDNGGDKGGDKGGEGKYSEAYVLKKVDAASQAAVRRVLDDIGYEGKDIKEIKEQNAAKAKQKKEEDEAELKKGKKWETLLANKDKEHEEALRKERERGDSYKTKYRTGKARDAIVEEAAKQGAVKPGDVYELIKDRIEFKDDSDVYGIKSADGESLTTVADAIKEFLKDRPHFVSSKARKTTLDEGGGDQGDKDEQKKGDKNTIETKYGDKTDGEITHANMTIELNALRDDYRSTGKSIDQGYQNESQRIIAKYSGVNKRRR